MAIISCPNCGQRISSKASQCVHCGFRIGKTKICEECGTEYPDERNICPNCGCPSKKPFSDFSSEKEREVYLFMLSETDKYPSDRYNEVKAWLMTLNDRQFGLLYQMDYKDYEIMLFISIFVGYLGVDRLILKDTKNGLLKLTMFLLSFLIIPGIISIIWWIKDIVNIRELVKVYNYEMMRKVSAVP